MVCLWRTGLPEAADRQRSAAGVRREGAHKRAHAAEAALKPGASDIFMCARLTRLGRFANDRHTSPPPRGIPHAYFRGRYPAALLFEFTVVKIRPGAVPKGDGNGKQQGAQGGIGDDYEDEDDDDTPT